MKIQRLQTIVPLLAVATLLSFGSPVCHAQRFSLGGTSIGKSRSGGSSTLGGSLNFKNFGGHSSKIQGSTSKVFPNRTTTIKHLIGNASAPSKGFHSPNKTIRQIGDLKSTVGKLTNGKSITTGGRGRISDAIQAGVGRSDLKSGKLGNFGQMLSLIDNNRKHNEICISNQSWCHSNPKHCHWWYDWCHAIRYCEPVHYVHCGWQYVTCDYVVDGRVIVEDARWYLGLKGLFLPGKGIGIEEVTAGSPAAEVGLQPGMVITRCNGVDLVDETALNQVIEHSDGVLQMDLLLNGDQIPATCVVVMQRVTSVNY